MTQHRPPGQLRCLGPGLRVGGPGTPPFGARGRSSVRYGTRLGDLKENWFLFVFQLNTQHTHERVTDVMAQGSDSRSEQRI